MAGNDHIRGYAKKDMDISINSTKKDPEETVSYDKRELRHRMIKERASINDKSRKRMDKEIFDKVISLEEYSKCDTVLIYASYNGEVDTYSLIDRCIKDGKRTACPVCRLDEDVAKLDFYCISSRNDLIEGYRGIPEPDTERCTRIADTDIFDALIIVPLVAFDKDRNRLGYGKGFYDRFLAAHKYKHVIGLAYSCQECDTLPVDENDVRLDMVVCGGIATE